jgi:UDP-N-acetylglucosamine 2-epimerase
MSSVLSVFATRPELLEEALDEPSWAHRAHGAANPFGEGDVARRIAGVIRNLLAEHLPLAAAGVR